MKITWNYGKNEITDCYFVRKKVFVEEQGFDGETEFDGLDSVSHHLLLSEEDAPIATARLFNEGDGWHCGRICILASQRGKGLGLFVMNALEEKAKSLGADMLELSAQVRVVPFYERAGYEQFGEEYLDEHCPHVRMKKRL